MKHSFTGISMVLALTAVVWAGAPLRLIAAGSNCPDGDSWIACQAQNGDPLAMYVMGRNAYDEARKTGDFTAPMNWARKVVAAGNPNGKRLLKMVHLQLGWAAHKDYVQAYVWLSEAIAGGDIYLVPWRKMLMEKMTPEQIAEAKKRAGE